MSHDDDVSEDADAPQGARTGYGRPPAEHRFKKGVSGNPRGGPRKRRSPQNQIVEPPSVGALVLAEAYRPIKLRENDRIIELPMIRAVLRSLGVAAVKGNHRAQIAITGLVQSVQERNLQDLHAIWSAVTEYKQGWQEVFEDHDRRGVPRPEPVPHPDELLLDHKTGELVYNGPIDDHQKVKWDQLLARKQASVEAIAEARKELAEEPGYRQFIENEIAFEQRLFTLIDHSVPDEKTRRAPGFDIREWRADKERRSLLRGKQKSR